ncbi:MAG: hypothetical protein HOF35_12935 [Bacteroidetes bacterium]|jgi:hypothetical protein|nr:hypothetical protein [Bacteroidota bacterium]
MNKQIQLEYRLKRIEQLLLRNKISQWMVIPEVIKYTSLSKNTIIDALKSGALKYSKKSGGFKLPKTSDCILVRISDIERWIDGE